MFINQDTSLRGAMHCLALRCWIRCEYGFRNDWYSICVWSDANERNRFLDYFLSSSMDSWLKELLLLLPFSGLYFQVNLGELVPLSSSTCCGREALGISGTEFYMPHVLPATQLSVSNQWSEQVLTVMICIYTMRQSLCSCSKIC